MNLYEELHLMKKTGNYLDFSKITYDEMYQLWFVESMPDSIIAELYDVEKKQVTRKRTFEFQIRLRDCLIEKMVRDGRFDEIFRGYNTD